MPTVRNLLWRLGFKTDTKGADKADKRVDKLTKRVKGLKRLMGGLALGAGGFAIAGQLRDSVTAARSAAEGFGLLQTFAGDTGEEVAALRSEIRRLSDESGKPLEDITRGAADVMSIFGKGPETIGRLEVAVDTARAGFVSTLEAVQLLGVVSKNYGDTSVKSLRRISDFAFQVVEDGNTTFQAVAASIGRVAPIAKKAGISMDEMFAVYSTGTGVVGDAAEVSTGFRAGLNSIINPSTAAKKALKSLRKEGIKSGSDLLKKRGYVGAMRSLIGTTDGSVEAATKLFPNIRAQGLMFAFSGALAKTFDRNIGNTARSQEQLGKKLGQATGGYNKQNTELKIAETRARNLRIELGEKLMPMMAEMETAATNLGTAFADELGNGLTDADGKLGLSESAMQDYGKAAARVVKVLIMGVDAIVTLARLAWKINPFGGMQMTAAQIAMDTKEAGIGSALEKQVEFLSAWKARAIPLSEGIVDPERLEQRRQFAVWAAGAKANLAETGGGSHTTQNVGGIVINIPAGSTKATAEAAAAGAEQGVRRANRQIARRIARGSPAPAGAGSVE